MICCFVIRRRKKGKLFCCSTQSHLHSQSFIMHKHRGGYSTMLLLSDDQEKQKKNDIQLKTLLM